MTEHGQVDAEREMCRIADVRAARLIGKPGGTGLTVRILAVGDRPVEEIVADVRAAALRSTGKIIGRDDVHVVQLEDADAEPAFVESGVGGGAASRGPDLTQVDPDDPAMVPPFGPGAGSGEGPAGTDIDDVDPTGPRRRGRVTLDGVLAVRHGLRYTVEVTLHHEGRARTGSAMGTAASSVVLRLVTEATLAALAQIRPAASTLAVETTTLTPAGQRSVALVTLVLLGAGREELLVGSAMVHDVDIHEAVARAALDATNRRLQLQG